MSSGSREGISRARVGVAGWSLSRGDQDDFPADGTHLQKYAAVFNAAEINSSFYRPHRPSTYERWAEQVPADFRFSVKIPKTITHVEKLHNVEDLLDDFLPGPMSLDERLGCLLIQLPPSLAFEREVVMTFFDALFSRFDGAAVCEPRHESWFTDEVDQLLREYRVSRVAADPARVPEAAEPGGNRSIAYYRLHGSPRMYYSLYTTEYIDALSLKLEQLRAGGSDVWCIFDNTVLGGAIRNALQLSRSLEPRG